METNFILKNRRALHGEEHPQQEKRLLMPDRDALFRHDSISEGHSFTITVGLSVSADLLTSRWGEQTRIP